MSLPPPSAPSRRTLALLAAAALALGWLLLDTGVGPGHWIEVNGHELYYETRGYGPPLLLLHGGGDSGAGSFSRQFDDFTAAHRLIAPDQIGQGRTPDVPGPLSYTAMMNDTIALLDRLRPGPVDVVGYSDGGILALMLAVRRPDLVRRLVVSGANLSPDGLTAKELAELRTAVARARGRSDPTLGDRLNTLWLHSPTPEEISPALLAGLDKPVLVMSGDRDAITLEHTLAIYRALPKAELCILPGTGHGTFGARPQWVNPIILDFLGRS